jgi:hypothetical protein
MESCGLRVYLELSEDCRHYLSSRGFSFGDFTCSLCENVEWCPLAFDEYSTHGHCLRGIKGGIIE